MGHGELVRRHVFALGQKGREGAARHAAAQRGRGRARAERGVAERFGGEVDDRVGWDRVDAAGRDDDGARLCREPVVSLFLSIFFFWGPPSFVSYGRTWGVGLGKKKARLTF